MPRKVYTAQHEPLRAAVAGFIAQEVRSQLPDFVANHGLPARFWAQAAQAGLLGLRIPDAYGGAGSSDPLLAIFLIEELARVSIAVSSCMSVHAVICPQLIVEAGTQAQQARWLPSMASGQLIAALAVTEPGGGSDLAALRSTATRSGANWVLNGAKIFITNGGSADLVLVAARTSPDAGRGITLFGVSAKTPGFRRGPKLAKVGLDESDTSELFFEDLVLSDDTRIGGLGEGLNALKKLFTFERLIAAASNIANTQQILTETIEYTKTRMAFGQPIGSFQANKFTLAELATEVAVTQAFVDQCIHSYLAGTLSPAQVAQAKWWSASVQNRVLDACLQLHGGNGYMLEYRVARAWRDARVTRIWAGTNEMMKEIIGRELGL